MSDTDTSLLVRILGNSAELQKAMKEASHATTEATEQIKSAFEKIGTPFEKLAAGIALMTGGLGGGELAALAKEASEYGDSIERASQKTGIAAGELQGLRFAAQMSDVGFGQLQSGLAILSRKLSETKNEASPTSQAFRALGIDGNEAAKMPLEETLRKVSEAFAKSEDGAGKSAIAMALFGRAGAEMIPWLNKGAEGLDEMTTKFKELGLELADRDIATLAAYDERLKLVHAIHENMATQIGLAFVPALTQISVAMQGGVNEGGPFKTFLEGLGTTIREVTIAASHLAQGFQEAGTVIGATMAQLANPGHWSEIQAEAAADLQKLAAGYEKLRADVEKPLKGEVEIDMGKGGDGAWGKKKELHFQLDKPEKAEKPEKSRMGEWDAQLAQAKVAYEQLNDLRKMDAAEEATYWKLKLNAANLTEAEKTGIQKRAAMAELAAMHKLAADGRAIEMESVDAAEQTANAHVAVEEERTQRELQMGRLTNRQAIELEIQFEAERTRIALDAQKARVALTAADPNHSPQALKKEKDQLLKIEQQHVLAVEKLDTKMQLEESKRFRDFTNSLGTSFNTAFTSILTGQASFSSAMQTMWKSIASAASDAVGSMVVEWIKGEIMKRAATRETQMSKIAGDAASAAASAYDAIVGIPYVGPFLAPVAAAAAFAGVMAFGGSVPSAEGGFDIAAGVNPMTQLHEREMVLPAKHADVIRGLADNGGGGGGGGTTINITAMDGKDVHRVLMKHGDSIAKSLGRQRGNFNPAAA